MTDELLDPFDRLADKRLQLDVSAEDAIMAAVAAQATAEVGRITADAEDPAAVPFFDELSDRLYAAAAAAMYEVGIEEDEARELMEEVKRRAEILKQGNN